MKLTYKIFILALFTFSSLIACKKNMNVNDSIIINLKWNKSYDDDSIEKARFALSWCYSYLGAHILNSEVLPNKQTIFFIDINKLGFDKNAIDKITLLHEKIKDTEHYKKTNQIDLGRYISLLIGSSEHYYAITNIPKTFDKLKSNYVLNSEKGYVNNSSVSFNHRVIEYSNQNELKQLFISTEIDTTNNSIFEFETIEIMPNGQLKFGIYDKDGNRINTADEKHTKAGKPAKCIWCHESNLNKLFRPQNDFIGYLKASELNDTLVKYNKQLHVKQSKLKKGIDYSEKQQHSFMEIAYISFMEPSAMRLSNEWNMSKNEVEKLLSSLKTHTHEEFSFLGNLYHRNEVEKHAPYNNLEVSSSIREKSKIEVNHLN